MQENGLEDLQELAQVLHYPAAYPLQQVILGGPHRQLLKVWVGGLVYGGMHAPQRRPIKGEADVEQRI